MMLSRPLALVGMMGAGKSSLGRRLALRLSVPFTDSDDEITAAAGMSIADIFQHEGEAGFRKRERETLHYLLTEHPVGVLAVGGGAFMDEETRKLILEKALTVWIKTPLNLLAERVTRHGKRPLLKDGVPEEVLAQLLKQREPVYALAHVTVESDNRPQDENVARLLSAVIGEMEKNA